jgi:hypothetical protein
MLITPAHTQSKYQPTIWLSYKNRATLLFLLNQDNRLKQQQPKEIISQIAMNK